MIEERIHTVFREVFDNESMNLTADTSDKDLEDWDSVAQVKLVLAIEAEFGLQFSSEEVTRMHSVGDFVEAVRSRTTAA